MRIEPVFLFDLDGTLVDSVYQHVLAWKEALDAEGIELSVWRIHRKIGMSGGLFTNQLLRETGLDISAERVERLRQRHAAAYRRYAGDVRPLPGARELLSLLVGRAASRGRSQPAGGWKPRPSIWRRSASIRTRTPVVTRDQVKYAKPDPDLFLAAAERLDAPIETAVVVGDSIWDMLAAARCRALGVGLLSGGYGLDELQRCGRVPGLRGSRRLAVAYRRGRRAAVTAGAQDGALPRGPHPRRVALRLFQIDVKQFVREQQHPTRFRHLPG